MLGHNKVAVSSLEFKALWATELISHQKAELQGAKDWTNTTENKVNLSMTGRTSVLPCYNKQKNSEFFPYKDNCEKRREQLKFYFSDKVWISYEFLKCDYQLAQKSL
jgi:hypothetical protein